MQVSDVCVEIPDFVDAGFDCKRMSEPAHAGMMGWREYVSADMGKVGRGFEPL